MAALKFRQRSIWESAVGHIVSHVDSATGDLFGCGNRTSRRSEHLAILGRKQPALLAEWMQSALSSSGRVVLELVLISTSRTKFCVGTASSTP